MQMVCDTNILIAYLNGEHAIVHALHESKRPLYISAITVVEVLALPKLSKSEISVIQDFLLSFVTIPLDNSLAQEAATLCRYFKLKVPDSIIAATALYLNLPLATRDKEFLRIKNLEIVEI